MTFYLAGAVGVSLFNFLLEVQKVDLSWSIKTCPYGDFQGHPESTWKLRIFVSGSQRQRYQSTNEMQTFGIAGMQGILGL